MEAKKTVPQVTCSDCGKGMKTHTLMKSANIGLFRCKECQRTYNDNLYLDNGSESVIREDADREKRFAVDLHNTESELDRLLEDY